MSAPVTAATTATPKAGTVDYPFNMVDIDVFGVREGLSLGIAMGTLGSLLDTVHKALNDAAEVTDDGPMGGVYWAAICLLRAAMGLQDSIHEGFMEYQRQIEAVPVQQTGQGAAA